MGSDDLVCNQRSGLCGQLQFGKFDLLHTFTFRLLHSSRCHYRQGKDNGSSAISLLGETLPPGNYLLPVSLGGLSGQGDASINIDKETVANYFVIKQGGPINRDHWTVTANTEEKTGEVSAAYPHNGQTISLIDGEINTFWHSKWQGGEVAPPYEIILDMGKENSVSQLGLIARQNALTSMNLEIYAGDDGETWTLN